MLSQDFGLESVVSGDFFVEHPSSMPCVESRDQSAIEGVLKVETLVLMSTCLNISSAIRIVIIIMLFVNFTMYSCSSDSLN